MIIKSLKLRNFRNYENESISFEKGINVITGDNGAGKTNLIESIYYLSIARSFRAYEDDTLIQEGKQSAVIDAVVERGGVRNKIKVSITTKGKKIEVDGKKVSKLSTLSNIINATIFDPRDVLIFQGSPKNRRQFLNLSLSKKTEIYFENLMNYEKILKERNDLLKEDKIDSIQIDAVTDVLIKYAEPIITYRSIYIDELTKVLEKIYQQISGVEAKVNIYYYPFIVPSKNFKKEAKEAFKHAQESDLKKKVTTIGPHREDFSIALNSKNISEFGSQGENRMMAIALKLAPYFLIDEEKERPIVILDDVMSELDKNHQQKLYNFLKDLEQVFITATHAKSNNVSIYLVKKGNITRRNS